MNVVNSGTIAFKIPLHMQTQYSRKYSTLLTHVFIKKFTHQYLYIISVPSELVIAICHYQNLQNAQY